MKIKIRIGANTLRESELRNLYRECAGPSSTRDGRGVGYLGRTEDDVAAGRPRKYLSNRHVVKRWVRELRPVARIAQDMLEIENRAGAVAALCSALPLYVALELTETRSRATLAAARRERATLDAGRYTIRIDGVDALSFGLPGARHRVRESCVVTSYAQAVALREIWSRDNLAEVRAFRAWQLERARECRGGCSRGGGEGPACGLPGCRG